MRYRLSCGLWVRFRGDDEQLWHESNMIIDWHTHVHSPREQAAPFWRGQCPATIDNVLRLHDEVGLDLSVISNSGHYLKDYTREEALPAIREANEYLAVAARQAQGPASSRLRSRSRAAATTTCASSSAR